MKMIHGPWGRDDVCVSNPGVSPTTVLITGVSSCLWKDDVLKIALQSSTTRDLRCFSASSHRLFYSAYIHNSLAFVSYSGACIMKLTLRNNKAMRAFVLIRCSPLCLKPTWQRERLTVTGRWTCKKSEQLADVDLFTETFILPSWRFSKQTEGQSNRIKRKWPQFWKILSVVYNMVQTPFRG